MSSLIPIAVTISVIVSMDPIMLGYVILTPILRRSYLVASVPEPPVVRTPSANILPFKGRFQYFLFGDRCRQACPALRDGGSRAHCRGAWDETGVGLILVLLEVLGPGSLILLNNSLCRLKIYYHRWQCKAAFRSSPACYQMP